MLALTLIGSSALRLGLFGLFTFGRLKLGGSRREGDAPTASYGRRFMLTHGCNGMRMSTAVLRDPARH